MHRIHIVILALSLVAAAATGQPREGDLIITLQNPPMTIQLDPATGVWSTLVPGVPSNYPTYVQMASDNHDLMVCAKNAIFRVTPAGGQTTVATSGLQLLRGFELDYDGTWLIPTFLNSASSFWAMDDLTGALSTLYVAGGPGLDTEMAIDRDPLAPPYVIASFSNDLRAGDRSGRLATIAHIPNWNIHGVELDPATGDYLTTAIGAPAVALVSKSGLVRTLTQSIPSPSAARFNQDGTAWVTGFSSPPKMFRIDMQGVIITAIPLAGAVSRPVGVEVYGSRRLVCNGTGKPATTVQVKLQSRKLGDGSKPYLLAASFLRHPGLRMPNGEILNLTPDNLFALSASGSAPSIFPSFQGTTDPFGNASARIQIPASLPGGLKIPIFVAGAILDPAGVRTVTNTHWFVLN